MSRRFFSWEQASRMLPLVRRIVEDIVTEHGELEAAAARYDALDAAARSGDTGAKLQAEVDRRVAHVEELVAELHELGCLFKGVEEGLVDWYSRYAGRPVFLCWKLGEPEIEWWHQLDAGFIGRQPVLPDQREAFTT